jgi:sucrose-6-phosphate hydrolase SacC (GH32 family)
LRIYADRTGLEIFVNDGWVFMPININFEDANRSVAMAVKGGAVKFSKPDVYELKRIW